MAGYQTIRAEKLGQAAAGDGVIIDVRTGMEHAEKRLTSGHEHVPLDELKPTDFMMRRGLDKDAAVYLLCRAGGRAAQAAEKFSAEGYRNVHVVEGGLVACEECGHELEGHDVSTGGAVAVTKGPLPLERQVRIAAGLIAGVGALLALTSSSLFAIVPLFVSGGLIFSGVTDRCGMALVLAKAPWNKTKDASCATKLACDAPIKSTGAKTGQSCQ